MAPTASACPISLYRWSSTTTLPIFPSNALPVPLTVVGLVRRSPAGGAVMDMSAALTSVASQMPPLVFLSRRLRVTVIVPLQGLGLFTVTTALRSLVPPPLTTVVVALVGHLSRFTAKALAVIPASSFQG